MIAAYILAIDTFFLTERVAIVVMGCKQSRQEQCATVRGRSTRMETSGLTDLMDIQTD